RLTPTNPTTPPAGTPSTRPCCRSTATANHPTSAPSSPMQSPIMTPNGKVEFLQVVGLTMDELEDISSMDELETISSWNARRGHRVPPTDLSRKSWLTNPAFVAEVARRSKQDDRSLENVVLQRRNPQRPGLIARESRRIAWRSMSSTGSIAFGSS